MPTETGGETIGERLTRLRSALVRARETIARAESNGQSNAMGGSVVTEIAYDRALARERELVSEIAHLEARLSGTAARRGIAVTRTITEE
jgi:hypothetical protein